MYLTEQHKISRRKNKALFNKFDSYCYASKNLYNLTNYLISQCSRISYKLKQGEILDSWEKAMVYQLNCVIKQYNEAHSNKCLFYIDENNGFIANAYFLCWLMKAMPEYKALYSTCSQTVIQAVCNNWKAFYQSMKAYKQGKGLGFPHKPKYLDKDNGRNWLIFTYQNIKITNNCIQFPKFIGNIALNTRHQNIKQVRVITKKSVIVIELIYEAKEQEKCKQSDNVLGIDLGINNLMTICGTNVAPIIINGRALKSINQYYNKEKARLQSISKVYNKKNMTKRICALTERRNNKVKDMLHKASRYVINFAVANNISKIVVGNNKGWKQNVDMGKKTNQTFASIPFERLIAMLTYKAQLVGIDIVVVEESYTSGTSYLDNEQPNKQNYNNSRRVSRGKFISNNGIAINADVNAAHQIIKKSDNTRQLPIRVAECVRRINVA